MPKKLEKKLKNQAANIGLKGKRVDAYVYGTLRNKGWKPKRERQSKTGHNITKNLGY